MEGLTRGAVRSRLTEDDVLSNRQVAELLAIPQSTVEDLARRGVLRSTKIGKRRRFLREHIEAKLRRES
jgi:excisionase family DNA binding protein